MLNPVPKALQTIISSSSAIWYIFPLQTFVSLNLPGFIAIVAVILSSTVRSFVYCCFLYNPNGYGQAVLIVRTIFSIISLILSHPVIVYDSLVFTHSCHCPVWKRAKWLFQKSFGVLMGNGRQLQADTWNFFHLINSHSQWTFSNTGMLCTLHNMYMLHGYHITAQSQWVSEWVGARWNERYMMTSKLFPAVNTLWFHGDEICARALSYFHCFFSLCALGLIFNGKQTRMNECSCAETSTQHSHSDRREFCFASSFLWIQLRCWTSSAQARAQAVCISNCNNCGYLKPNSCPWTRKNPFTLIGTHSLHALLEFSRARERKSVCSSECGRSSRSRQFSPRLNDNSPKWFSLNFNFINCMIV